ncbi:MAG: phosphoglycerate mutase family protein, partial [Variovorax sp.]
MAYEAAFRCLLQSPHFFAGVLMQSNWPDTLWIVRHGQSAGNIARDAAESGGLAVIDLAWRDIDVPLSPLGVQQSKALAEWFDKLPPDQQPEVVLCSPYLRAKETARLVS